MDKQQFREQIVADRKMGCKLTLIDVDFAERLLEAAERADTLPDIAAEVVKYNNEHVAPMVREEIGKIKKAAEAHRDRLEKALRKIASGSCGVFTATRVAAEALKEAGNGKV